MEKRPDFSDCTFYEKEEVVNWYSPILTPGLRIQNSENISAPSVRLSQLVGIEITPMRTMLVKGQCDLKYKALVFIVFKPDQAMPSALL